MTTQFCIELTNKNVCLKATRTAGSNAEIAIVNRVDCGYSTVLEFINMSSKSNTYCIGSKTSEWSLSV